MTTEFGPCEPWPVMWPCDVSCESPTVTGRAVEFATEVIWGLSGRQFGLCEVTLRPCRRDCYEFPWPGGWNEWPGTSWLSPALIGGQWFNIVCGTCPGTCACSQLSEVLLPAPVNRIVEVKVDGDVLVTGAYRLDDSRVLVRTDGGAWPRCNELELDDDQAGTWSVTASYGREVPAGGEWAVGELACELLKAFKGEDCRLPRNVTQLARQGVTISYPDMNALFDRGRTGLYLADLFIATWNPNHLNARSKTYSIDRPRHRRAGSGA